jgi:hypothetical protein
VALESFAPGRTGLGAVRSRPPITSPRTEPTAPELAPGVGGAVAKGAARQVVRPTRSAAGRAGRPAPAQPIEGRMLGIA